MSRDEVKYQGAMRLVEARSMGSNLAEGVANFCKKFWRF